MFSKECQHQLAGIGPLGVKGIVIVAATPGMSQTANVYRSDHDFRARRKILRLHRVLLRELPGYPAKTFRHWR